MRARSLCLLAAAMAPLSSCFVPDDARPGVDIGLAVASKFVHRGMTLVDEPVLQPDLGVTIPTEGDGVVGITVRGNLDLRNDTGDAWFPSGHAGRFTQIDQIVDYTHTLGGVTLRGGLHGYTLPNGLEFENGERGNTSEVFVTASAEVLETTPYVSWHYDFDEVRATYYRAGLQERFELADRWSLTLDGSLGYVTSGQALWMYGLAESGVGDLRGSAILGWAVDARTTIEFAANGSSMQDQTYDDWFRDLGIADDVLWFSLGVAWSL
jgi:hypothetical protein